MLDLIVSALGFVVFGTFMLLFNVRRLQRVGAFPFYKNKPPSAIFAGFSYFIFLKFDRELTLWAVLAWIGLILIFLGLLMNKGILQF